MSDPTGYTAAPSHYAASAGGMEVIDTIWQELGTEGFIAFCRGNVLKYEARAGKKGGEGQRVEDLKKAQWYREMALHAAQPLTAIDPRERRNNQ